MEQAVDSCPHGVDGHWSAAPGEQVLLPFGGQLLGYRPAVQPLCKCPDAAEMVFYRPGAPLLLAEMGRICRKPLAVDPKSSHFVASRQMVDLILPCGNLLMQDKSN